MPALISGAQLIYEFLLVDRDPLPRWTVDQVTLLGDATHPMYPVGSNRSAQAILHARYRVDCLADSIGGTTDINYQLREYEAERLPRTAAIVLRNRMNGPEQVMQIASNRKVVGGHGVFNMNPTDHYGHDKRARVLVQIVNGDWKLINAK